MSVFKNAREWKRVRQRDLFELTSNGKRPFGVFLFLFLNLLWIIDQFENLWKAADLFCRKVHICV